MIKSKLENYSQYSELSDRIKEGFDILLNTDFNNISDGRHDFSEYIYMNVQTYMTKSDADYEAHREYVDIQYIISGHEKIGVAEYDTCTTTSPYSAEKDIEFLNGEGEYTDLNEGEFMILYPNDAHKPSITAGDTPQKVRKAVVKVKLF